MPFGEQFCGCSILYIKNYHIIFLEVGLASFIWQSLVSVWEETVDSWSTSAVHMKDRILWICHQPSKSPFSELKMPSMLIHPFYRNFILSLPLLISLNIFQLQSPFEIKGSDCAPYSNFEWNVHDGIMVWHNGVLSLSILKMPNSWPVFLAVTEQWINVLWNQRS